METPSSTKNSHECEANKLVYNCLIGLPLSIPPFPLLSKLPTNNTNKPNHIQSLVTETSHIVHNLHYSILHTADKCLKSLHLFTTHNPLFATLSSLSSHYHNFCQINCRNYRNLNSLSSHNFAAILPGDSVAGIVVANGVLNFLNIYNTLLVVRLVLTWFPSAPPAIVSPLSTICDPYLNIFRGLIPPLGGTLDLSPILAFLVLNALTSTASALPAELPPTEASKEIPFPSSQTSISRLTTSQKKWMRRFDAKRSNSDDK